MRVILGLGTNQGNREENLQNALKALALLPNTEVLRLSSIYETEPYGYKDQPNFLNMVAEIETDFSPNALLGACLGIEAGLGRVRLIKNGPRIMDIDVLLCENYSSDSKELTVPHPEIRNRSFVLVPLQELYPSCEIFGYNFKDAFDKHPKNDFKFYKNPFYI